MTRKTRALLKDMAARNAKHSMSLKDVGTKDLRTSCKCRTRHMDELILEGEQDMQQDDKPTNQVTVGISPQDGIRSSSEPDMKDSGERQVFATGAVRDAAGGKAMLSLISPLFEERLGQWLTLGAKKYSADNWAQGIPMRRTFDSLMRHVNQYRLGDRSEDHLGAIACNAMFLIHFEEMIAAGLLPAELDDLPRFKEEEPRRYLVHPNNRRKDDHM